MPSLRLSFPESGSTRPRLGKTVSSSGELRGGGGGNSLLNGKSFEVLPFIMNYDIRL